LRLKISQLRAVAFGLIIFIYLFGTKT